jgi:hypothetical protein
MRHLVYRKARYKTICIIDEGKRRGKNDKEDVMKDTKEKRSTGIKSIVKG